MSTSRLSIVDDSVLFQQPLSDISRHSGKLFTNKRAPNLMATPRVSREGSRRRATTFGDSTHKIMPVVKVVAIGVSTGGPDALVRLLSELPVGIDVPVVIVQHMPAAFTGKLAERLNSASEFKVVEARRGEIVRAGTVYIAPGDYHMVLKKSAEDVVIGLDKKEPENSCRPSVDKLFRSLPEIYNNQCLGVIMTGMGADGLNGCQVLSDAGCPIIVQDEASSVVWGMPGMVAQAGLAQREVPLDQLASVIVEIVKDRVLSGATFETESVVGKVFNRVGGCS